MNQPLGRLEKIDDLRQIWKSEAKDFTPWLAEDDNLELLGDIIGLDLELESTEKEVGPFRADILCKETGTDHWVLVENQIEKTDHTHLGQILTYAAGLNAVTIVWIAKQFSDEHRAALDWLNEITGDAISFFGLEVELWKIGSSPIAPKFNIVSKPNEWTKGSINRSRTAADLTPVKQMQLEFWTEFRVYALANAKNVKATKPLPQHWMNFSLGRSDFGMYAFVDTRNPRVGVRMFITSSDATAYYHLLLENQVEIENEFSTLVQQPLSWEEAPGKKSCFVSCYNTAADPNDRDGWGAQFEFLLKTLEAFHQVFSDRIKKLDAGDWNPAESEWLGRDGTL